MKTLLSILGGLANVAIVLLVAPFFQGVLRKITALIQSRQGPPIWQPYFDLLKLLGKEDIESGESPLMQRFAVYLSLATVLTVLGVEDGLAFADRHGVAALLARREPDGTLALHPSAAWPAQAVA